MAKRKIPAKKIEDVARSMGFEKLRTGQKEAIQAVTSGQDTLVIMPTGAGKSAIYHIAGILIDGPTVVISPLLALQKDQIGSIEEKDVAPAAALNSRQRQKNRRDAFRALAHGDLEFIFLAPEQFNNEDVLERVVQANPSLFVVDEAHCISQWGHDFRPDYLRLGKVIENLKHPVVLAMTATASQEVREEIISQLGMRKPACIITGFDRPNIWLGVRWFEKEIEQKAFLLNAVAEEKKPGIVYVATHKHAEELAMEILDRGENAVFYHGGMNTIERDAAQREFMEGRASIIVATNAFGMGIDKPDVRFVYHFDAPDSLDSYYQEIGRAGRDGQPAVAVLFYRPQDLNLHKFFAGTGRVRKEEVEQVIDTILSADEALDTEEVADKSGLSVAKTSTAISGLEETGAIDMNASGKVEANKMPSAIGETAEEASQIELKRHEAQIVRIEIMRNYAETHECRRGFILHYFGETYQAPCDYCDRCESRDRNTQQEKTSFPFPVKSWVIHTQWGKGVVEKYEGDKIIVLFSSDAGRRSLSLTTVLENNLLTAA